MPISPLRVNYTDKWHTNNGYEHRVSHGLLICSSNVLCCGDADGAHSGCFFCQRMVHLMRYGNILFLNHILCVCNLKLFFTCSGPLLPETEQWRPLHTLTLVQCTLWPMVEYCPLVFDQQLIRGSTTTTSGIGACTVLMCLTNITYKTCGIQYLRHLTDM